MPKIIASIILFSIALTPCLALAQEQKIMLSPSENILNWVKKRLLFVWSKIYPILNKEVEQRRPDVENELKKETEEIKEEIKKQVPSLWQRFLDLIK